MAAPAGALPDPFLLSAFAVGSVLMRGAGCTANDLWDRDIDSQVARTRSRPLACGAVTPRQAQAWGVLQLGLSAGVLFSLSPAAVVLGVMSLVRTHAQAQAQARFHTCTAVWRDVHYRSPWGVQGLVGVYPLAKRVTHWPQLMLGLTFNWGALLGWTAVHNELESGLGVVLPLYASCIAWTLVYDTIYAHQDKHDDATLGLGSTALTLGEGPRARAALGLFGCATIAGLLMAGRAAGVGDWWVTPGLFSVLDDRRAAQSVDGAFA